jgi:hypothetical protein
VWREGEIVRKAKKKMQMKWTEKPAPAPRFRRPLWVAAATQRRQGESSYGILTLLTRQWTLRQAQGRCLPWVATKRSGATVAPAVLCRVRKRCLNTKPLQRRNRMILASVPESPGLSASSEAGGDTYGMGGSSRLMGIG